MAKNTTSTTINFKGVFDISNIMDSLNTIKKQMKDSGANDKLFKGVEKRMDEIEIMSTNIQKKLTEGFSSKSQVDDFNKSVDQLKAKLLSVNNEMKTINANTSDYGPSQEALKNLDKMEKQLADLNNKLLEIQKMNKNVKIDEFVSRGIDKDLASKLANNIKDQEKFNELLKEEYDRRKAINEQAANSSSEKKIAAGIEAVGNVDLVSGYLAVNSKAPKMQNDWRQRNDKGKVIKTDEDGIPVFNATAQKQANDLYIKALQDTIKNTIEVEDAVGQLSDAFEDHGVKIINLSGFTEQFTENLEKMKEAMEKVNDENVQLPFSQQDLESVNLNNAATSSEWENICVSLDVDTQEENDLMNQISQAEQRLENAQEEASDSAAEAQGNFTRSLSETNEQIERQVEGIHNSADATSQQIEQQNKLDTAFGKMTDTVKTILSIGTAWQKVNEVIRQTINDITELDKSFAEIAMVTDYQVNDLWGSYNEYAAMANELGQSTKDVIASSALYYQQG